MFQWCSNSEMMHVKNTSLQRSQRVLEWQPNLCICLADGECICWGTCTQSLQHLSLSVTHAVVMLFFFTNRCEATIVLIFSTVRRYSAHKHTLVPITASIKDESDGREGNPFLGYCHPQCHWMNGRVVHLSRNATYPHTWRQRPAATIHFKVQRCRQLKFRKSLQMLNTWNISYGLNHLFFCGAQPHFQWPSFLVHTQIS